MTGGAGWQDLIPCRLYVFDLDGTVYQETSHFADYGAELAERVPEANRADFLRDVDAALNGRHTLGYGRSYDPKQRLVVKDGSLFQWTGEPVEGTPSEDTFHIDDPWGIYGMTATHYGASPNDVQAAFLAVRAHMESPAFPMTGLAGLRPAIDGLRRHGRVVVLATNSPEGDSRAILAKLGLTGAFDAEVFNAVKQLRAVEHFRSFHDRFKVTFPEMVSIGDHYRNEIAPAVRLGMKTICIDRYHQPTRTDVTVRVSHPKDVIPVLQSVVGALDARG